jgi:hypothetical protein
MENSIARKLEPPILNPLEIESTLLNRLASIGQKNYAERSVSVSQLSASVRLTTISPKWPEKFQRWNCRLFRRKRWLSHATT